jgi:hypothetical protein
MKRIIAALLALCFVATADSESVPSTAVVVSTSAVTKTIAREPRIVVLQFATTTGELTAEVTYETVTRVDGEVVLQTPFKAVSLTWQQITNLVPSLAQSLVEFKSAARASLTNAP